MSASQKWDLLKGTLKSAAETTIGRTEPRQKNSHCHDMAAISETQRKHLLQINVGPLRVDVGVLMSATFNSYIFTSFIVLVDFSSSF